MDQQQVREMLTQLQFSAELPEAVLDELAEAGQMQDVQSGTTLFREGAVNENVFLISAGSVALEMQVPGRGRVRIQTLGPGDLVAWSALLGRGEMTTTAVAQEDTRLISVSGQRLQAVCDANHEIGYALMRRLSIALSQRLLATRLQLLDLFSNTSPTVMTDD